MKHILPFIFAVLLATRVAAAAPAAAGHETAAERPPSPFSTAPERVKALNIALPSIGNLATRHAKEIASSSWSVGGETLDRDFTVYDNYKDLYCKLGKEQKKTIKIKGDNTLLGKGQHNTLKTLPPAGSWRWTLSTKEPPRVNLGITSSCRATVTPMTV